MPEEEQDASEEPKANPWVDRRIQGTEMFLLNGNAIKNMKTKQLQKGWKEVELGDILDYEQPGKYIVDSTKYNNNYKTPVLTAGKSFLLGYTNEIDGIYNKLPVIIFDDFTTANKFVDFPFKVKSSAMKLLTPKNEGVNLKFIFLLMQTLKLNSGMHKRYYLSKYQHIKVQLPPFQTQKKIVKMLEQAEQLKQKREQADKLMGDYLKSVFNEMFLNNRFELINLSELCNKIIDIEHKMPKKVGVGIPFISAKDVVNDGINFDKVKYISEEDHLRLNKRCNPEKEDLLYSRIGTIGIARKIKTNKKFTISYSLILLKPKFDKINNTYLEQALNSPFVFNQAKGHTRGIGVPDLNMGKIKSLKIPLLSLQLQQKFASIVEKVEKIKEAQKKSKQEIYNLFNALMQKAFRGEIK